MAHNNAIDQFTSNLCMFSSQDNQKCKLCFTESEILELKKKKKEIKRKKKENGQRTQIGMVEVGKGHTPPFIRCHNCKIAFLKMKIMFSQSEVVSEHSF